MHNLQSIGLYLHIFATPTTLTTSNLDPEWTTLLICLHMKQSRHVTNIRHGQGTILEGSLPSPPLYTADMSRVWFLEERQTRLI